MNMIMIIYYYYTFNTNYANIPKIKGVVKHNLPTYQESGGEAGLLDLRASLASV